MRPGWSVSGVTHLVSHEHRSPHYNWNCTVSFARLPTSNGDLYRSFPISSPITSPFNWLRPNAYNLQSLPPSNPVTFFPPRDPLLSPPSDPPPRSLLRVHTWIMSDLGFKPWSDNPNAPKISHALYILEKADFAGYLLTAILYGAPRTSAPTCPSICAHFIPSVYIRDAHRAVLQMYDRTTQPHLS